MPGNLCLKEKAFLENLMVLTPLVSALNTHDVEVAETLIGVINFLMIFVAARTLAEILVRLSLPMQEF